MGGRWRSGVTAKLTNGAFGPVQPDGFNTTGLAASLMTFSGVLASSELFRVCKSTHYGMSVRVESC